jgi:FAD/FMN-containing dehydrogenase
LDKVLQPIEALCAELVDLPLTRDPALVRQKSRDFFWYSPVLKAQLNRMSADVVVTPRSEAEVVRIAAACARHRIPLTPRGGGTGNYGQAVPLQGGVLLDLSALTGIEWQRPGMVRVEAGAKMIDLDAALRPAGWELRMHPSTKRTATVGGFVAGGSGGIGSVTFGGLRDPGNVLAARIVTLEPTPRVLELRDRDALKINHAYGTTGIITAVEVALGPAWPWIEFVAAFDDLPASLNAGLAAAQADGIVKKLLTPIAWPIPCHFRGLQQACPEGQALLLGIVAEPSLASLRQLIADHGGTVTLERPAEDGAEHPPIYEYTWNHTTLNALRTDKSITYLQTLFPAGSVPDHLARITALLGDELQHHLEIIRFNGRVTASGLPLFSFTDEARLNEIIALHEANGIRVANPHVFTLEDGSGHKRVDADQLGFKHQADPAGLLNPGKMRSYRPAAQDAA